MSGLPRQPSRKSEIKSLKWEHRWCHSREKEHATSTDWQSWPKTCRSFFRESSSAYVEIFDSEMPDLSDRWLKNSHGRKGEKCPRKSKKQIQRVWWATAAITTAQRSSSVCKITWNEKWRNTSEVIYCDVANICRNRGMMCVFSSHPEGRGATEIVQGRVGRIQQLMEALREERVKMDAATGKADICQHVTHEYYLPDWGSDEDLCAKSQNLIKIFNCLPVSMGIQPSAGAEEKTQRRQQEIDSRGGGEDGERPGTGEICYSHYLVRDPSYLKLLSQLEFMQKPQQFNSGLFFPLLF